MTARLPFLFDSSLAKATAKTAPVVVIVFFSFFLRPDPVLSESGQALCLGAARASVALFGLFFVFLFFRPDGWSSRRAIDLAETITLWLAALVVVAGVL